MSDYDSGYCAGHESRDEEVRALEKDAARYRFLRNTLFVRDIDVPDDFTGDVLVLPPRYETYYHGTPITKDTAFGKYLDAVIDAALDGTTASLYTPLKDAP